MPRGKKKTITTEIQTIEKQAQINTGSEISINPQTLISLGLEKGVDIATMEKLFAMRRELKEEAAKESFYHDFALFQSECPIIQKNKTVKSGGFAYEYASLDATIHQIQPFLTKYGFSFTFKTEYNVDQMIISCEIHHKHGHMETAKLPVIVDSTARMNSIQKNGSAITYTKRYALYNALGLGSGETDDDGQSTSEKEEIKNMPPSRDEKEIKSCEKINVSNVYTQSYIENDIHVFEETPSLEYMDILNNFFIADNTNKSQKEAIIKALNKKEESKKLEFVKNLINKKEAINRVDNLIASLKSELRSKWINLKDKCSKIEDYENLADLLFNHINANPDNREKIQLDKKPINPIYSNNENQTEPTLFG